MLLTCVRVCLYVIKKDGWYKYNIELKALIFIEDGRCRPVTDGC